MAAASSYTQVVVKVLLENGADMNQADVRRHRTPFCC